MIDNTYTFESMPCLPETRSSREGYLQRLKERRMVGQLSENIEFAIVLGWAMILIGSFHRWILLEEEPWSILINVGLCLFLIAIFTPMAISPLRLLLKSLGNWLGVCFLKSVLCLVYFSIILPASRFGYWSKKTVRGQFCRWTNEEEKARISVSGWTDKIENSSLSRNNGMGRYSGLRLLNYFLDTRNYALFPSLLICLLLALLGFFVQATGLAPMIYTLF